MKNLIMILLFSVITFTGCSSAGKHKQVQLITPRGEVIETKVSYTPKDLENGLSGVKTEKFKENDGMLFFFPKDGKRNFWMPDTYFNLDIIYLDENFKILTIVRDLPHYIGWANQEDIPRAPEAIARHVLEMKAGSPIAEGLSSGDELKWKASFSVEQVQKEALESN